MTCPIHPGAAFQMSNENAASRRPVCWAGVGVRVFPVSAEHRIYSARAINACTDAVPACPAW